MVTGKWSEAGVPHKGWLHIDVEDLGEPNETCEMCEQQLIRYVHLMEHPEYPHILRVGCVCAENMSDDYKQPKSLERKAKNRNRYIRDWMEVKWLIDRSGQHFCRKGNRKFGVTLQEGKSDCRYRIFALPSKKLLATERGFDTLDDAKLGSCKKFRQLVGLDDKDGKPT